MIHLSLDNCPYIERDTGTPVEGRMKVFLHDTNTLAPVYSLEGQDFVRAANPTLLHTGLPVESLFVETGLYDIVIDKFIGLPGSMSVDSPDADFAQIDEFEQGIDFDLESLTANQVDTVEALRGVDPSLGVVRVLWYAAPGDCQARNYIWDAASQNQEDGGYVIGSDISDTGRWILLWDSNELPCTVYGVTPGDEGNMNSLLSYPQVVGSFQLATAPCVYFPAGTYTFDVSYTTSKELVFNADAQFTKSTFTCSRASVLGKVTDYVADILVTSPDAAVHSSWYRSLKSFWTSGAKYLHVDDTNYFTDSVINANITLADKVILGTHRLDATYVNSACITVNRCDIGGKIFTPAYDYVRLSTDRGDHMFVSTGAWDPGLISAGHHVQYDNVPDLDLFDSTERWYAVMDERKARMGSVMTQTVLDFQGRTCSTGIDTTNWAGVRNVIANGGIAVKGTVALSGVTGNVVVNASDADLSMKDCQVTIPNTPVGLASISAEDCDITVTGSVGIDPADTAIYVRGGSWSGYVKLSDAHANSYAVGKAVSFTDVSFPVHFKWRVNLVSMTRCEGQVSVDLIPYANGEYYSYACNFTENVFTGNSRIWFTMFCNSSNQHPEVAGKVNFDAVRIVYNRFNGSDARGVKMLRWHPYTVNQFMANDIAGYCEYHDNSGACPRLSPGIISNADSWTGEHMSGSVKWRTYAGTMNIWAPYAVWSDGSVNEAKDATGLTGAPSGAAIAYVVAGFGEITGSVMNVVATGYQNGLDLPPTAEGFLDEDLNDMFILRPCITVGLPACPQYTTGYTLWYKPNVV